MNLGSLPRHPRLLLGAFLGLLGCLESRGADWQALTGNSPFGPAAGATPVAAPDQLEFRGVVQEEGVFLVNLYNPATKTSQWIPVNGKVPGIEVKSYDADSDKIEILQGGRPLTLSLKQARVTLVQQAAPAPVGTPEGGVQAGPGAPEGREGREGREGMRGRGGPGNGENAPMVRNLPPEAQAMIQEFRRRRAERANNNQQPQQAPQGRQP